MAVRKTQARRAPQGGTAARRRSAAAKNPAADAQTAARKAKTPKSVKTVASSKAADSPAKPKKGPSPKPAKLHRKPIRDSFTMPEADFALIATLKAKAMAGKRETKKSELLRAGLHALAQLETAALVAALGRLEPVKIGRPKKGH